MNARSPALGIVVVALALPLMLAAPAEARKKGKKPATRVAPAQPAEPTPAPPVPAAATQPAAVASPPAATPPVATPPASTPPVVAPSAPAPVPVAEPGRDPATGGADVAELSRQLERIREGVFATRARAAALGQAIYTSRVRIRLVYRSGRFYQLSRATVRLDGVPVFEDPAALATGEDGVRFEGFVAPGRHQISVRLEADSRDDARFGYATEDTFSIDVPARRIVEVRARAEEAGDLAWEWKKSAKGNVKIRLDAEIEARELDASARK